MKDCQVVNDKGRYAVYSYRVSTILSYGTKKKMEKLCDYLNKESILMNKKEKEDRLLYGE